MSEWTGEEALLLRSVKRESVREFAGRLGIDPRTVTYWKKRPGRVCRAGTQQILDAALAQCTAEEQEAFRVRLATLRGESALGDLAAARPGPCSVVSHKFLPVHVGERLAPLYAAGVPQSAGPGGLERRVLPGGHRTAHASAVHVYTCGIAVVHLEEHRRVESMTELAVWRYRSYLKDRSWAGKRLRELLVEHSVAVAVDASPEYVLSAYELREHSWAGPGLETALQLLTTPSVLVNRQDPENVSPLGSGVEDAKFAEGWKHPEAISFGGGVSQGVAGWSGVSYHPQQDERALTMSEIVDLELDAQALWALSSHILHMVEDGRDPVMPDGYGWRYLRGAYSRLTAARPTETAQHRVMREAILATSELPDRLRAAQDALRDGNP
ncbi:XRE family transcriptional regulator [Streptomyces flavofungini]|uniref:XRE family transcriptional regulator n=1 Tax=Streptomyces flavofungini TaxID=68200 RepID=UPI0025B20C92|nr:XRE family transcriptional regulator [Streptomyces flavofungini]WJV51769.1 XRE family transcriptional regulator [Streptomyces flavofungini]